MNPSYDNGFGSFGSGGATPGGVGGGAGQNPMAFTGGGMAPINSGTGDVIIGGAPEKKSKKGVVVVLLILAVLAIGAGVAWVVVNRMGGGGVNNGMQVSSDVKSSFNRLANYTVSGEQADKSLSVLYDVTNEYYFIVQQRTRGEQETLYGNVDTMLSDFVEKYNMGAENLYGTSVDLLNRSVSDEKALFDFMKIVYIKEALDFADVLGSYTSGGRDAALSLADGYYNLAGLDNNEYAEGFSVALKVWINDAVGVLDLYNNANCLVGGIMNDSCVLQSSGESVLNDIKAGKEKMSESFSDVSYYYNLDNNFVLNIFVINNLFDGKGIEGLLTTGGEGDSDE